jgi:Arc/MetJ-type ribon-helix-helix transcriptional regulator
MIRSQIVLDEPTAHQLRRISEHTHSSMSDIVRQALAFYFQHREPDTAWIGSLRPTKRISHDLDDIRASVAAGHRRNKS